MLRKQLLLITTVILTACAVLQSCKKTDNSYRNSTPDNKTDLNMYDYMRSKKGTFDTLLYIIERANLTDTIKNSKITFFAPTDLSILTALDNLNANRRASNLEPLDIAEVDPFVWRTLLMRYMIPGKLTSDKFMLADGLDVVTLNKRRLHVNAVATTTQGSIRTGSLLLQYSDLNGSRFTKDWIFSYVTTSNLETNNGILNILEPSHVFGFKSFVTFASTLQNPYSDRFNTSSGAIVLPTATRIWMELNKTLTAIDQHTVETDAADLKANGFFMRLTVNPTDNSVTITSAPTSANLTIRNNGDCHYDPVNQEFVLKYKYTSAGADRFISERIKLRNY
ncbi:BT_3044 domain-containing protein [Pedobacter nyackensis]|uniref:BT_3044 domain-containing protein n=1 Tax=Pedobacter nyackensis TaxID=475255 RepID=UPI00292EE1AA|nr:DUF4361 domain-containing protein [Pedobacter nyackensis]